jgi:hypothetical protein
MIYVVLTDELYLLSAVLNGSHQWTLMMWTLKWMVLNQNSEKSHSCFCCYLMQDIMYLLILKDIALCRFVKASKNEWLNW